MTMFVAQAARAYRAGYRKGLRRAVRQLEQEVDSDKADDESAETSNKHQLFQMVPFHTALVDMSILVNRSFRLSVMLSFRLSVVMAIVRLAIQMHQLCKIQMHQLLNSNSQSCKIRFWLLRIRSLSTIQQWHNMTRQWLCQYDPAMAQYDQAMAQYDAQMDDEMIAQYDTTQPTVSPGPVAPATMLDPSVCLLVQQPLPRWTWSTCSVSTVCSTTWLCLSPARPFHSC